MKLRKLATVFLLVAASFTTAFTAGTVTASQASASVAASPALDAAACSAAYHFHHVNAARYTDEALWQSAYQAAMAAALKAGPEISGVIVHYLREGDQWSWVRAACAGYRH